MLAQILRVIYFILVDIINIYMIKKVNVSTNSIALIGLKTPPKPCRARRREGNLAGASEG